MHAPLAVSARTSDTDVIHVKDAPVRRRTVRVGAADDRAEVEADAMAAKALALSAEFSARDAADAPHGYGTVHRSAENSLAGEFDVDAAAINRASGSPHSLAGPARARMEIGFGRDLGGVRVHSGPAASSLAADLGARAFTLGSDVYFGAGEYRPESGSGDQVLAHELAHTVQAGTAVHRYPASWMTQPVPWGAQTADIVRPGSGLSGGVYILKGKEDNSPIRTAVIKPTFGKNAAGEEESGGQIVAADRLMREFGLNAPASRVVKAGTPEFKDLIALCTPKAPPQPKLGDVARPSWKPLSAAQDVVVMSEIVKAKTLQELAVDSHGSNEAKVDLVATLCNPNVMHDFGLMMIADMVVGNGDRFVGEAKNLGNVMVSVINGKRSVNVFDTTAFLPAIKSGTEFLTKNAKVSGSVNLGWASAHPEQLMDDLLGTIVQVVKDQEPQVVQGTGGPDGARSFGDRLERGIAGHRPKLLGYFMGGWNAGVAKATQLSQGDQAEKVLGDLADEGNVQPQTLKAAATYVSKAGVAGGDKEAGPAAQAVVFARHMPPPDLKAMAPDGGIVDPSVWVKVPSEAVKADWVDNSNLPTLDAVEGVRDKPGMRVDGPRYQALKIALFNAHGTVKTALPDKRRMGKTSPRNRALLGAAVVNAEAVAAGMIWLTGSSATMKTAAQQLQNAAAVAPHLTHADAVEVAAKAALIEGQLATVIQVTEPTAVRYRVAITDAARVIGKTKFPDRDALADVLKEVGDRSKSIKTNLAAASQIDCTRIVKTLRARVSAT